MNEGSTSLEVQLKRERDALRADKQRIMLDNASWESTCNRLTKEREELRSKWLNSDGLRIAAEGMMDTAIREREELREKIQYVTGQLIEAGCDDGAAPVEELARRAKNGLAELRAELATKGAVIDATSIALLAIETTIENTRKQHAAEVEKRDYENMQFKADKARLDWLQANRASAYTMPFARWGVGRYLTEAQSDTLRDAIDAAMKGAQ